jgi:hypothetical protein
MMRERRVAGLGDGILQYLIFVSGVSPGDTDPLVCLKDVDFDGV